MKVGMLHQEGRLQTVWKLLAKDHQVEIVDCHTKDYDLLVCGLQVIELDTFGKEFWDVLNCQAMVICGNACEEIKKRFTVSCLLENEEFLVENAVNTAWGLLTLMIKESQNLLVDAKVDIIGYGRCGRAIHNLLQQLQIETRVIIKDSKTDCKQAVYFEDYLFIQPHDYVICTAPVSFLDKCWVQRLTKQPTLFDITSNRIATHKLDDKDIRMIQTGSLPDQYLKHRAGNCYYQMIKEFLR